VSAVDMTVRETVSAAAAEVVPQLAGNVVAKIAARVGAARVVSHLEQRAAARHRSFMPHDFYLTAARATVSSTRDATATISITGPAGIRLRYFGSDALPGGAVRASGRTSRVTGRPITKLAVPDRDNTDAQARTPADFSDLRLVVFGRGPDVPAALVRGKGDAMRIYYWLRDATIHQPDSTVLPNLDEMGREILAEVSLRARAAWKRKAAREAKAQAAGATQP